MIKMCKIDEELFDKCAEEGFPAKYLKHLFYLFTIGEVSLPESPAKMMENPKKYFKVVCFQNRTSSRCIIPQGVSILEAMNYGANPFKESLDCIINNRSSFVIYKGNLGKEKQYGSWWCDTDRIVKWFVVGNEDKKFSYFYTNNELREDLVTSLNDPITGCNPETYNFHIHYLDSEAHHCLDAGGKFKNENGLMQDFYTVGVFTRKFFRQNMFNLFYDGENLKWVRPYKYLKNKLDSYKPDESAMKDCWNFLKNYMHQLPSNSKVRKRLKQHYKSVA